MIPRHKWFGHSQCNNRQSPQYSVESTHMSWYFYDENPMICGLGYSKTTTTASIQCEFCSIKSNDSTMFLVNFESILGTNKFAGKIRSAQWSVASPCLFYRDFKSLLWYISWHFKVKISDFQETQHVADFQNPHSSTHRDIF